MNTDLIITVTILIAAMGLFLSNRFRADFVAMLVVVALGMSGVLTATEAFSGFSRSAVITILAIFVLAEGLQRAGVTEQVGDILLRVGGRGERRLVVIVMLAGAFLSLIMNNIAAAAVLLPAISGAARKAGVPAARLLMPLAFATLLGGMATLFTTGNIVVSSFLRDNGYEGFGVLDFAPLGVPIVVIGIVYVALWGRRLLPTQSPAERLEALQQADGDLVGVYALGEALFRARVPAGSVLIDMPLSRSPLRHQYYVTVVAIEREGQLILAPRPTPSASPATSSPSRAMSKTSRPATSSHTWRSSHPATGASRTSNPPPSSSSRPS